MHRSCYPEENPPRARARLIETPSRPRAAPDDVSQRRTLLRDDRAWPGGLARYPTSDGIVPCCRRPHRESPACSQWLTPSELQKSVGFLSMSAWVQPSFYPIATLDSYLASELHLGSGGS
jgi:hypothetical protein